MKRELIEKYLIEKGKKDLLSSLKRMDKKIIKEKLENFGLNSIEQLSKYIIGEFELCLRASKDDIFTQMYFQRLLSHENSAFLSAYQDDIEGLWVFVYENNGNYSYYIPTEIKQIIKKEFNWK